MSIFTNLFKKTEKGASAGNQQGGNSNETKKCLNCLRRVDLEKVKCPHCRSENFQF